jgi:purine-binding chemotaxis protein CheW
VTQGVRSERWDRLARAAALPAAEPGRAPSRHLLACSLAGGAYALPVERVREIVRVRPITPVPRTPPAVLGVLSLRGTIVQVVDLRLRLRLPAAPPGRGSRIAVVEGGDGELAGLLVDAVTDVLSVATDALRPAGAAEGSAVEALFARGERFVSLLDLGRVLDLDAGS